MADEVKKVLEIDVNKSITSLKDYKKHIDELRASLLSLDETSEEYKNIATEIKEEQDKLNQVMAVGKKDADAVDGSYNKLVQTMAELKRQWKATGDEAERNVLGQQILEINNKLKDLDASTGNFQRNVGDYGNAFEEAFKTSLDKVQGLGGSVGSLASDIKKLIPLIKATSKAATTGVEGFKASISSTGIGGIIILLSTLVTKFVDFIKKQREAVDTTEAFEKAQKDAKDAVDKHNKELQRQITLMRSLGASSIETAEFERDAAQDAVTTQEKVIEGLQKELEVRENNLKFNPQAKKYWQDQIDLKKAEIKANEEVLESLKETLKDRQVAYDAAVNQQKLKITDGAKHALQTQEQALKEEYENDIKFLEEHGATQEEIYLRQKQFFKELKALKVDDATTTDNILDEEETRINEYVKTIEELSKKETNIYKEKKDQLEQEYEQRKFNVEYDTSLIGQEEEVTAKLYDIEHQRLEDKISLQQEYIDNLPYGSEQIISARKELSNTIIELDNLEAKHAYDTAQAEIEAAQMAADKRKQTYMATLSVSANVFGSMAALAEEGSQEQKTFAIMETTINTIEAAVAAFKSMSSIPVVGPALGAAAAAAATAFGIANINKIKNTKKGSSNNLNSGAAQVSPVNTGAVVRPMLNEQADLNKINSIPVKQDSEQEQQNIKVYVTETDIAEATHKAEVRDSDATF